MTPEEGWEKIRRCAHRYRWHRTSIGGFAQCELCSVLDTAIKESDCIGYITPEQRMEIERKRKAKRDIQQANKKVATIEWLKKNGKPTKP